MSGKLTGVDLRLKNTPGGSVYVSIETIGRQDRLPTGVVMVSADQPVTTAGWYHFSFPTGLACLAGGRLAIVIQFGDTHSGASLVATDNYPGGQALWKGAAWAPLGVGDFAFRTYVDTAAPTSTPTLAPTPTPTPVPTATPTPAPTATPKPAPTATPKPAPTASPKPTPTASLS